MANDSKIYIDATSIGEGGGLVLLEYLASYLEKHKADYCIIGNKRLLANTQIIKSRLMIPSLWKKAILYTAGLGRTIYFCNRGPLLPNKYAKVYVHSEYITLSLKDILKLKSKNTRKIVHFLIYIINWISAKLSNNKFFVQTDHMQQKLANNRNIESEILPFFPDLLLPEIKSIKYDLCYISYPWRHKNHSLLFDILSNKQNIDLPLKIAVTIPDDGRYPSLIKAINEINDDGKHTVYNLDIIDKKMVPEIYAQSRAVITLSSKESFGLSLIEAAQSNIPVIAPNMPYVSSILQGYYPVTIDKDTLIKEINDYSKQLLSGDLIPPQLVIINEIEKLVRQNN